MPSKLNRSNLSTPLVEDEASMTIMWNNGTEVQASIDTFDGYHITKGALNDAGVNVTIADSSYGHYMTSLGDEDAPADSSWWWSLYQWNSTNATWETSPVGMDGIVEPKHIAWAPSIVNASDIPAPVKNSTEEVCSGHGWEMGSGESLHCMCDDGYTWDEGEEPLASKKSVKISMSATQPLPTLSMKTVSRSSSGRGIIGRFLTSLQTLEKSSKMTAWATVTLLKHQA